MLKFGKKFWFKKKLLNMEIICFQSEPVEKGPNVMHGSSTTDFLVFLM